MHEKEPIFKFYDKIYLYFRTGLLSRKIYLQKEASFLIDLYTSLCWPRVVPHYSVQTLTTKPFSLKYPVIITRKPVQPKSKKEQTLFSIYANLYIAYWGKEIELLTFEFQTFASTNYYRHM